MLWDFILLLVWLLLVCSAGARILALHWLDKYSTIELHLQSDWSALIGCRSDHL